MGTKFRVFLLLGLMSAAACSALGAYRSVRPLPSAELPGEVYRGLLADADRAEFLLRGRDGYIAVFPNRRGAEPEELTPIPLSTLRAADRAMLERGIPAANRQSLLQLLEDLGS